MKVKVAIADYGLGNLHSVYNAFKFLGIDVFLAERGKDLEIATHVVLPGVGAFSDGMKGLQERGHDEYIIQNSKKGKPVLGICLGTQLFFSKSYEYGENKGLGLINGTVEEIPSEGIKKPFVGWSRLCPTEINWSKSILQKTEISTWAYFVHSYHCVPQNKENLLAVTYGGKNVLHAAVKKDNITGLQFHPEKSGSRGLEILQEFAV